MGLLSRLLGKKPKQHGHDLIKKNENKIIQSLTKFSDIQVIEIGSQRKAGSTKYLARLCDQNGYQFFTVDLNKETTKFARSIVKKENQNFQAINDFGEKFLAQFDKEIHLVYLDAFDVDGDWHSNNLRDWYQSVGSELNDQNCWKMHLDCAEAISQKMPLGGIVAFDDVNPMTQEGVLLLEDVADNHRIWKGKGKTAIPLLIDNGFRLIDHQKGTALFQRVNGGDN